LFDSHNAATSALAQLFAQEQLRLSEHARQRIINLMAHMRHEVCNLRQSCFLLGYQGTQLLLSLTGLRLFSTHLGLPHFPQKFQSEHPALKAEIRALG
jgi:hypothetical protein